jgi:hypothetical protein
MDFYTVLNDKFIELLKIEKELEGIVRQYRKETSSKFSLDGQIIGAFAEQIVALAYDLTVIPNKKGYDAETNDGTNRKVEIKVRSGKDKVLKKHLTQSIELTNTEIKEGRSGVVFLSFQIDKKEILKSKKFTLKEVYNNIITDGYNDKITSKTTLLSVVNKEFEDSGIVVRS